MKQILIVDDNIASLTQIGKHLDGIYDVILVKSGHQALRFCESGRPDLILIDVEMPEMDGFETLEMLKKIPDVAQAPVIFITGNIDEETEIKALESGAIDFITKPVEGSILLHRLELHLQLYSYQTNLENMSRELENSVVECFADLIECKDENTGGHVLRTSRYVEIIGRALLDRGLFSKDLTETDLEMMVRAAPFHDIGKIGVSDVILLKPGPLTEDEYALAKEHTRIGGRILLNIYRRTPSQHYLKVAALMAEGHHERYDGHGYPCGLAGCDIPLCCRIMAVANVYDACITDRIYRRGMTHEEAHEIITKGAGTAFDPLVVKAFEEVREGFLSLKIPSYQLFDDSRLI
ncbi:MAG: response regulator [Synergistaceae bacterium]|nr:response regulator [Synergistaceae bacterium]